VIGLPSNCEKNLTIVKKIFNERGMPPRVDIRRMAPRADGGECLRAVIRASLRSAR
jgi:hypothetical protein